jgi:tetratricopeptide (TPR) repeat protein
MTSLETYNRAISAMIPDDQIAQMNKPKSPHTLRRILSEDSPAELVARFAGRVKEVMESWDIRDNPLSPYELARISFGSGDYETGLNQYMEAASKNNDGRAYKEVGTTIFYFDTMQDILAVEILHQAIEHGINDCETNLTLGLAYEQLRQKAAANPAYEVVLPYQPIPAPEDNKYLNAALQQSQDQEHTQKFINGYLAFLANDAKGIDDLEYCAARGNDNALQLLRRFYEQREDVQNTIRILETMAKKGRVHLYSLIGTIYRQTGNIDAAITAYKRAVNLGDTSQVIALSNLLISQGKHNEAMQYARMALVARQTKELRTNGTPPPSYLS